VVRAGQFNHPVGRKFHEGLQSLALCRRCWARFFAESRKGTNKRSVCLDVEKSSDVFPVKKLKQDRVNSKNSKNN